MPLLQETRKAIKGFGGKEARTIYVDMGVWLDPKTHDIHLTIPTDKQFHTTVSNKAASKRYHSNLYMNLEKLLKKQSRWF